MAQEGEIDRPDIITDAAIKAPLELIKNLKSLVETVDDTIASTKELQTSVSNTKSVKHLSDEIKKLTDQNKNLSKIQDELAKRLDKLEKENKELNRVLKEQEQQVRKNKEATERLDGAMDALDSRVGGNISRWKELGKELLAIAKHPIILAIGVIIGLLYSAAAAVRTFWTHTGEGEDIAARQSAVWSQFFASMRNQWSKLGESIQNFFGEDSLDKFLMSLYEVAKIVFPFMTAWINKMQAEFLRTKEEAKQLADLLDDIGTRQSINIVKRAEAEKKANELLSAAQDDLMHTDIDRLVLLERYLEVKKQQLQFELAIARDAERATIRQIGLEHGLTEAQVMRMNFQQRDAKFTGEEMKKIAEARAEVIRLEGQYLAETRKVSKMIIGIKKEMHAEEVRLAKEAAKDLVRIANERVQQESDVARNQIADVQRQTAARLKDQSLHWRQRVEIIKNSEELIKDIRQQAALDETQNQIKALETTFRLLEFDKEEQIKVAEEIKKLKLKLINDVYENSKNVGKTQLEKDIENLNVLKEHYDNFANGIGQIFQNISQRRLDSLDKEMEKYEENLDLQLAMAGDNEERKKEIEQAGDLYRRNLERKRIQEERRMAIFEKATSLIQAGINGALAVTNQLAKGDPYTAFARAAAAGVAAGIQVIAIASKQIPQYRFGGTTTESKIIAGEEGFEHYKTPQGVEGFTPNTATMMELPIGTKISSHKDTLSMIARRSINPDRLGKKEDIQFLEGVYNKLDTLNHTMSTRPLVQVNYSPKGVEGLLIKGLNKIKFFGDLFN